MLSCLEVIKFMKNLPQHNPAVGMANGEVYRLRCSMKMGEFRKGDTSFVDDQDFLREYVTIQEITLVSPHRCYHLWKNALGAKSVSGDVAQVGIYKGGSARMIADAVGVSKKVFLFDTFEGLPSHSGLDGMYKGDFSDTSLEKVQELFKDDENVTVVKGLFPQSAEGVIDDHKFAFVYLDVDLYESNKNSLEYFYPRMSKGGVIMIDDYGEKHLVGIQKSTDEFFADKKEKPVVTTRFQCRIQF
mgnify:CR=1 FL=1